MRKIIGGLAFDTSKAELVHEWSNSYSSSDFHSCEEVLYRTPGGRWFLKYDGGALSKYSVHISGGQTGSNGIKVLSEEDAREWLEEHAPAAAFEEHFPAEEA